MRIILASQSPARKKILSEMGLKFEIVPGDIDEEKFQDRKPSIRVKKIALAKARAVWAKVNEEYGENEGNGEGKKTIIIAADTLIYCERDFIGKPKNSADAKRILSLLSCSTHCLYTGICVLYSRHCRNIMYLDYEKTQVTFRKLSTKEVDEYVKNPEVLNHAGGYTIEKSGGKKGFIRKIKGSYSNVLGLPVEKLSGILANVSSL